MRTLISALLGSTIAAGLGVSAVQAADLPRRTIVAPAPVVAVPVFTWTGFYIGANAGYGFSNSDTDDASTLVLGNNLFVPAAPSGTLTAVTMGSTSFLGYDTGNKRDGFVGGGQIGYNYQFTPGSGFVIGVEADAQYAGFNRNSDSSSAYYNTRGLLTAAAVPDGPAGLGIMAPVTGAAGNVALFNNAYGFANRNIDWFATVRGRVGYAIDRLLIYGTAGVAFTDRNNSDCTYCTGYGFASGASVPTAFFASTAAATAGALVTPSVYSTTSSNNVGYAVGGGLEYAFTNNLTAKLEGLYVNFDRGNRNAYANAVVGVTNTGAPVTAASTYSASNQRDDFGVVRLGLNYKFSAF